MATRPTRRSRRRTTPPAPLPRPSAGESVVEAITEQPQTATGSVPVRTRRQLGGRAHHVGADYSYVRTDLVTVTIVSAVVLAFIVALSFVF